MAEESTVDTQNNAPEADASAAPATKARAKKAAAKKTAAKKAPAAKKAAPAKRAAAKKAAAAENDTADTSTPAATPVEASAADTGAAEPAAQSVDAPAKKAPAKKAPAKKAAAKKAPAAKKTTATKTTAKKAAKKAAPAEPTEAPLAAEAEGAEGAEVAAAAMGEQPTGAPGVLFQAPPKAPRKRAPRKTAATAPAAEAASDAENLTEDLIPETAVEADAAGDEAAATALADETGETAVETAEETADAAPADDESAEDEADTEDEGDEEDGEGGTGTPARRRRRRGGRRRRKSGDGTNGEGTNGDDSAERGANERDDAASGDEGEPDEAEDGEDNEDQAGEGGTSRRRRRRRRSGDAGGEAGDDPENTVTRVRDSRPLEQQITAVSGSTRLEAKKQRRREGREAGRRRAPIVSEAEFLARRESVDRVMVIRQREDLTQIAVLEDKVLVEHYVARESQTSLIGNIYLGRVQNVLPSMEAAFVDIGKGRNAVLYAGEVNWSALGWKEGQPRKIESVLTSGQTVLVQVTKDPIGHKGARLTSQISLAGRFLVYVPDGTTSGISRKLPDTERNRLKSLLKEIVPESAGVIVRTAAEGASEEELTRDVERLKARWEDIEAKSRGNAPQLLYGEPDLTLKVVRDLFTEDFNKLVIQGDDAWETVQNYVSYVAPDLEARLQKFVPGEDGRDAFATYRIDEQIAKGLDRKVWLPSGGSLIIDRTEAMTVVDVNTGKFTGSGGNLEETVTKNNLEAAEEIVRQLRLRDIGGIIVVDFIDMVLESNRDLVLRRLVECLGRDRTRHQVAEVTSLGLIQMTRKRIGTGLLEAFSETCAHCQGRGIVVHEQPVEEGKSSGVAPDEPRRGRRRGGRGKAAANEDTQSEQDEPTPVEKTAPSPAEFAAMARHHEEALRPVADAEESDDADDADAAEAAAEAVDGAEPAGAVVVEDFDESPADTDTVGEPTEQPAEQPAEQTIEQPEAPTVTVVTRTRRRGASRPAGATSEAAVPAPIVVTTESPAIAPEAAAPEPPKVITRTRGGARRAVTTAEPTPAPAAAADGLGMVDGVQSEGVVDGVEEHPVEHVPIKKKGARKR